MSQRSSSNNTAESHQFWFRPIMPFDGVTSGPLKGVQSAFENVAHTFQEESLHFVDQRLQHNRDAIEHCRECKDYSDVLAIQQQWFADLTRDYYDETLRIGEAIRKLYAGFDNIIPALHKKASRGGAEKQGGVGAPL